MVKKFIVSMILLAGTALFADTQQEIEHLLDFVEKTSCKYERNGKMYAGPGAREHITRKYEYYKEKIKSAEDFIKYSATKSKMSGRKYKVHCPGQAVQNVGDWLQKELKKYRQGHLEIK